jgi:hypothetical protein
MKLTRGIYPTYQRLHLSVLTHSGFTPKQLHSIAMHFRVPYKAMLNRYLDKNEPLYMEEMWTLATAARLPDPESSHQVGIAVLPPLFQGHRPGACLRPTAPLVVLDELMQCHKSSPSITSVVYRQAMEMIEALIVNVDQSLSTYGHKVQSKDMSILTLPSITLAAYTADAHPTVYQHRPLRQPKRPRRLHDETSFALSPLMA